MRALGAPRAHVLHARAPSRRVALPPSRRPGRPRTTPRTAPHLSHSLSFPPPLAPSPSLPERTRGRHRALPRPPATPRLTDALRGSTLTPSSSSPSHAPRGPLQRRHQLRLLPRTPATTVATPSSPEPPLSCRPIHAMHCEPLNHFPLLPCANSSSSSHFRRDRDLTGAGLVAIVVLVCLRPNRARHCTQCTPRST